MEKNALGARPGSVAVGKLAKAAAEKALVEKKRAEKEAKKQQNSNPSSKEELKQLLAEERFYEKNPEADLYRSEIEKYQKKGLSLNESYLIVSNKDKEIENTRSIY